MSTPFASRPGAQSSFDALRPRREEPTDRANARLDALVPVIGDHEDRIKALEAGRDTDDAGDETGDGA
jgi:hypothetical protein